MLELNKVKKSYTTGEFTQHALKDVSLQFRNNEFVAILGPSGSGKTTLLNIIGGLDRYDTGDLIINGKSTKKFKATNWDAYRNNSVGFIFQNYNLISHISVLNNVEMSMTLSGVTVSKRKKKALQVLDKVGLKKHVHKKPNQLSGGQMQRVAIARALVNNPDIILADEPTGALDTKTSIQIMNLIKEIAKDKLVIMVTHNSELSKEYTNRIIELMDGEVVNDTHPLIESEEKDFGYIIKKTSMNFMTALKLSFNNIITKKFRTTITAFAASIGIINIALILSLSNGFDKQISIFESETLSSFPIIISEEATNLNPANMRENRKEMLGITDSNAEYSNKKEIYPYSREKETVFRNNIITKNFVDYVENINADYISGISYGRTTGLNLLLKVSGSIKTIKSNSINFKSLPKKLNNENNYITENYDIIYGKSPDSKNDLVLIVDEYNRVEENILSILGFDNKAKSIAFNDIIGLELKLVLNNDYYQKIGNNYTINPNLEKLYNNKNTITLKVAGIVRPKEDSKISILTPGIAYQDELVSYLIDQNKNSNIVLEQEKLERNILTGESFEADGKNKMLTYLGAQDIPTIIYVYPKDFNNKDKLTDYLDKYNNKLSEKDQVIYMDMATTISSLSSSIMDAITTVLVAFSAISLVVSAIMIGIITYISVLERSKEIGILRALGARKKDIARVFNAETFIIGLCSGIFGIVIARLLIIPANIILENLTELPNVAQMNYWHALILIAISVSITMLGGYIPAKIASKKDPVEALRTE